MDLGFEPSQAASISVDYNDGGDPVKRSVIWQEVLRRVEAIPGVETAGITDNLPMSRNRSWSIQAKGKVYRKGELDDTFVYVVSPGYLNAIGMHLVRGRDFRWDDNDKKLGAVIIHRKDTVARAHRNRHRDGNVIRNLQFDCVASVRNAGQRSGYLFEHDLVAAAGGAAGRLYTGATRLAHRPNDCFTQQLMTHTP